MKPDAIHAGAFLSVFLLLGTIALGYIRIQCLTDSEKTSLTRIYKKPNDVGWKEFDKTDKPINLVIRGQFCSDNAGFGDTACTVSIEYLK